MLLHEESVSRKIEIYRKSMILRFRDHLKQFRACKINWQSVTQNLIVLWMSDPSLFYVEYQYWTERRINIAVGSAVCEMEVNDQVHALPLPIGDRLILNMLSKLTFPNCLSRIESLSRNSITGHFTTTIRYWLSFNSLSLTLLAVINTPCVGLCFTVHRISSGSWNGGRRNGRYMQHAWGMKNAGTIFFQES
jgi:hypothetical protein